MTLESESHPLSKELRDILFRVQEHSAARQSAILRAADELDRLTREVASKREALTEFWNWYEGRPTPVSLEVAVSRMRELLFPRATP